MKYLKYRKNKKKWSGKEAGQLLFMALAENTALVNGEKRADEPLEVTPELLTTAEKGLQGQDEWAIYAIYRSLYHAISNQYNEMRKALFKFEYAAGDINERLQQVVQREYLTEDLEKEPLIMSRSKCLDLARSHRTSFYEIFFNVLQASITGTEEPPQAIIDALEELKRTPAKDIPLFEAYRQPQEESEADILQAKARLAGVEPTAEEVAAYERNQKDLAAELLFTGELRGYIENQTGVKLDCTDAELEEAVKYIFYDRQKASSKGYFATVAAAFRIYLRSMTATQKEFSENLAAFDLLRLVVEEGGKYESLENKEMQREYFKQVKNDLPQLFASLEEYIKEAAQLQDLREGGYYDKCCTYAELEERHIIGFNLQSDPAPAVIDLLKKGSIEEASYSERMRAAKSGIALVNSDYTPQDTLARYPNPLENALEVKKRLASYEILAKNTLEDLHAFNELLEIIAFYFEVPQATTAKIEFSTITARTSFYNRQLYDINATFYGSREEVAAKREKLKYIFAPMNPNHGKPTGENTAKTVYFIEKMAKTYETGYQITNLKQLMQYLQGK